MKLKKLLHRKLFLEAQLDEVHLDEKARECLKQLNSILTVDQFTEMQDKLGLDLATRILYLYITENRQRHFIEAVDKIPVTQVNNQKKIKIMIVPGMHYQEHPEIGADGKLASDIAIKLGFEVELINIKSQGTVKQNVSIIQQAIAANHSKKIWLISLSKGSLEVRNYLQQIGTAPEHLRGWVSIGGICFGSKLADFKLATRKQRIINRLLCKLLGIDYAVIPELSTHYPAWKKDFVIPDHMTMINVVAMPLKSHISRLLQTRYQRLSLFGSNDGMILLQDYLQLPGFIYPIWGADHMMRNPNIGALLYKLYYFIHHQCYKDLNHEKQVISVASTAYDLHSIHC